MVSLWVLGLGIPYNIILYDISDIMMSVLNKINGDLWSWLTPESSHVHLSMVDAVRIWNCAVMCRKMDWSEEESASSIPPRLFSQGVMEHKHNYSTQDWYMPSYN